ncbi:MAG TPA: glycosyltransferase family 39 protein [Terriglobia bacterium]|nr:glycosyltransferase family 39 protein [Terriglobia bacterium]
MIPLLIWFLVVFFFYFRQRNPLLEYLSYLIQNHGSFSLRHAYSLKALGALGLAVWMAWTTVKCGGYLLSRLFSDCSMPRIERLIFSAGLGFGFISLLTFVLGVLHLWYAPVFWCLLILFTAAFLPGSIREIDLRRLRPAFLSETLRGWPAIAVGLLIVTGLIFLISGLTPEVFYDSHHYHLAVPNLYLLEHRIYDQPHLALSSFVMSVQMVWGFALAVGNEITAKLLHVSFALLLILTFAAFEKRYFARRAGLLGALMFLSMPLVGTSITSAGIDLAWTALQFLAAFALCRALEDVPGDITLNRWLCLAGILTGLAASAKYTGLPAIPVACLLIFWRKRSFRQVAVFLIPASLMIFPYLARNVVFHRNPLYPVGAENWEVIARDAGSGRFAEHFASLNSFLRFVLHPWFMTMDATVGNMDFVGPLLLALLPVLLLRRQHPEAFGLLARYALGLWIVWLLTTSVPRFGMPFLAMASLLVAHALLDTDSRSFAQRAVLWLCMAGVASNLYFTLLYNTSSESWRVLAGQFSEDVYLADARPTYPAPSYEAFQWMNRNLPPGSRIMMAGDSRSYYTRLPVLVSSTYDTQAIVEAARNSHSGADMARLLRGQGITHLFINFGEAVRTESYGLFPWDAQSWAVIDDFWHRYLRLIWVSYRPDPANLKGLFVFELLPDSSAPPSPPPPNPLERWKPK